MDAVRIEYLFAPALGIEMGKRGDVNDADAVRMAEPKYLVEALDKALPRLKERAESMPESDNIKIRIEHLIADLELVKDSIDKSSETGKIRRCML